MGAAKVTGEFGAILEALKAIPRDQVQVEVKEAGTKYAATFVKIGDDSEVRAYYDRALAGLTGPARQNALIRAQENCHAVSERPYSLAHNVYGWCAGSRLLSNLSGSRFAETPRGATLAECFRFGLDRIKVKGGTFRFTLEELPEEVRGKVAEALGVETEETDTSWLRLVGAE